MGMIRNKYVGLVLKISLALLVLFFLVHTAQIKIGLFVQIIHEPILFLCTILMFVLMVVLSAQRWHLLNAAQGLNLGFISTIKPTYLGIAFNNLLPGAIGGDFFRSYYVFKKSPQKKSSAVISIFFDRMFGLLGLVLAIGIVVITRISIFQEQPHLFYLLFLFGLFCLSILIGFAGFAILAPRVGIIGWLNKKFPEKRLVKSFISLLETMQKYRIPKLVIFNSLILSAIVHVVITITVMLIAKMMGFPSISFSDYIVAIGITQIVNLIPATPGGIGIGEMAFANIILLLNPGKSAAFATIYLGYRFISLLIYLPGVLGYLPRLMMMKQTNLANSNQ